MNGGENLSNGQYVAYWRKELEKAWRRRLSLPHGLGRRMLVAHPLKQLRLWLEKAVNEPDGRPVRLPAIYIYEES